MTSSLEHSRRVRLRCTRVLEADGWKLKLYESASARPRRQLVAAAEGLVHRLPQPPTGAGLHGVGFSCIDDGPLGCFALVAWWGGKDELRHFAYTAPADRPAALEPLPSGTAPPCSWHLDVIAFERDAWLAAVLADGRVDVARYLAAQVNTGV